MISNHPNPSQEAPEGSWRRRAWLLLRRVDSIYQVLSLANLLAFLRFGRRAPAAAPLRPLPTPRTPPGAGPGPSARAGLGQSAA